MAISFLKSLIANSRMNKRGRIYKVIGWCLATGIVTWILTSLDLDNIWSLIYGVDLRYFFLFAVLNIAAVMLASVNLFLLLREFQQEVSWKKIFYFDLLSLIGSNLTPGGVGGIATLIFKTNQAGVKIKTCIVAVFVDKLLTLFVALIGIATYITQFGQIKFDFNSNVYLTIAACLLIGIMLALSLNRLRSIFLKFIGYFNSYSVSFDILLVNLLCTVIIFFINGMQYLLAFHAVGIDFPSPIKIFLTYGVFLIINYLPITVSGLGLSEVAALYLWTGLGIGMEQVVSALVIVRLFSLVATVILSAGALLLSILIGRKG